MMKQPQRCFWHLTIKFWATLFGRSQHSVEPPLTGCALCLLLGPFALWSDRPQCWWVQRLIGPRQWEVPYRDIRFTAHHIWHVSVTNGRNSKVTNRLKTESVNLRLAVYRQAVCHGVKLLVDHDQTFFFWQLNSCGHSLYVISWQTRGWVCLI
jgi:hypothetical protein